MKKFILVFFLAFVMFSGLICLTSCKEELKDNEKTQNMIKEEMYHTYLENENLQIEDINIDICLGIFNDAYVARYSIAKLPAVEFDVEIENFRFLDSETASIIVWKNHHFYTLTEAYEKEILTIEDIETIYNLFEEYKKNR